jgi:integrase
VAGWDLERALTEHAKKHTTKIKKPKKPRKAYPLFAHACGQWAKKIKGRLCYFGVWAEPDAAEKQYLEEREDLEAGREPRSRREGSITLAWLANEFINRREAKGLLTPRHLKDCKRTFGEVVDALGRNTPIASLTADDFTQLASALRKPERTHRTVDNHIARARALFNFAYDAELIDKPYRYGTEFRKLTDKERRKLRKPADQKTYTSAEIRAMLDAADTQLRACILLGIGNALGNIDLAALEIGHVDLDNGVLENVRHKTGEHRRSALWPETIESLQAVLNTRRRPVNKEHSKLIFIDPVSGGPFGGWKEQVGNTLDGHDFDRVGALMTALNHQLGIYIKGRGFYALRHTFRTQASDCNEPAAAKLAMGHRVHFGIDDTYIQETAEQREKMLAKLRTISEHVHDWLFGSKP